MTEQPWIVRFIYKAPLVLTLFMGFVYAISMILNYREDTTNVTNAGFAIMASLAAISFSFARVIESEESKDRIMFAGERLLHGAVLILIASILKYFVFLILKSLPIDCSQNVQTALLFTFGLLAAVIFSNGVLFAHTGLRVLNDLLLLRFTRHKDWDDIW
jgi:hypothetical protein